MTNRLTHWTNKDWTFNFTSTTENPSTEGAWTTTVGATRSILPFQKKLKTSLSSFPRTQGGMWMREATYHTWDKTRVLITRARPWKDKMRWRQEERVFSTAAIRGFQLSSSRFPGPKKTPKTLIFTDNHSRATGGSERLAQGPSQRPLDLERLSLEPEPRSYVS